MSIINEALKKTEAELQKISTKATSLPPKHAKTNPILLYILILSAGFLLANFIFTLLKNKIKTTPTAIEKILPISQAIIVSSPAIIARAPLEEEKPPETNFVLNGIFFSDNDGYALVNNQIVREKDFVDGAKVSLITANKIELNNAGQIITLSTNR